MDISVSFIILVPIVLGLVQVAKISGLNSRWAALLAIALGIGGTVFAGGLNVLQGIVVGLSSAGLWSGTKATIDN